MLPRFMILPALLLAGCATMSGTRPAPAPATTTPVEVVQAELLAKYIRALQTVVKGTPTEQAEILDDARRGYEQERQGPATLRYALLLAAPEHPSRNPQLALRLLRESIARQDFLLSPVERALAIVEIARVEQELGLNAENERLVAEAQQERERQRNATTTAALTRQLRAESDENARLRKELDEARAKLEAIANIERGSSRPPANEGRKP